LWDAAAANLRWNFSICLSKAPLVRASQSAPLTPSARRPCGPRCGTARPDARDVSDHGAHRNASGSTPNCLATNRIKAEAGPADAERTARKPQIAEGQGKGDAVVIAALASDDGQILVAERGPRYRPRDTGIYGEPSSAIGRDDQWDNWLPAPRGNRLRR
jgi:hypothetical protein